MNFKRLHWIASALNMDWTTFDSIYSKINYSELLRSNSERHIEYWKAFSFVSKRKLKGSKYYDARI